MPSNLPWYRRLANAAGRLLNRAGRQPGLPAPPIYAPSPPPQEPIDYDEPLGGQWDYGEEEVYPPDEPPYEPPQGGLWDDWEPEDVIDLYDANYQYIGSHTKEDWFEILLQDRATVEGDYGYSNLDIIDALEHAGEWDQEDWREWRELYDSTHG